MPVGVAIGAAREFDLEKCVDSLWDMALCALEPGVRTLQRICAACVFLHREG